MGLNWNKKKRTHRSDWT